MSHLNYKVLFKRCIFHFFRFRTFQSRVCFSDVKLNGVQSNVKSLLENSASFEEKDPESDEWATPVYPARQRDQTQHSVRPTVDPKTTSVILFPGQGSQYVGMAKSLIGYPNVKDLFDTASEILRYDLLDLCINGPQDLLDMTVYSQVAVMVSSLAAVEKLRAENLQVIENCAATAGFSVGEYAALVFAGALQFEKAIRLLKVRGEAMQAASDLQPSGMMTVFLDCTAKIKFACASARAWCEEQGIEGAECKVAIYLYPDCKVISGHIEALHFLQTNAAKFGIKKIKHIPVSGAFHSKLMRPAKKVLEKALQTTPFEVPLIPVHANVDGKPYKSVEQIRKKLAEQLCSSVAWEQTMHVIFERSKGTAFPDIFECGPGTSMKAILQYNNREAYKHCSNVKA